MLRTHWITSASAAKAYFKVSDYYASVPGEWLGDGSKLLGLHGDANADDFGKLCDNLHPQTCEPLRPLARDGGRIGMDLTFNSTKSVGIAREVAGLDNAGDPRIEQAHREAVAYAMGFVEADMLTRVRDGGKNEDRATGNMVAYRVTHRDTRISAEDQMPDMSLHDHVFVLNTTYDAVEGKWKAAQMGQIKHDAPYYEAIYHNRLASNLSELGYGIRRDGKAFEVAGVSRDLIDKFSRRRQYIQAVADKLGITNPEVKSKLGATTRLGKAKELADDLNGYYVSRLTEPERQQLGGLIGQPSYVSSEEKAVEYAIGHLFERQSVVEKRKLYEVALRHGIGSVTPEGIEVEAHRQGVLLHDGEATTKEVLAEESRVIAFAREGRATCAPMGSDPYRAGGPLGVPNGKSVQIGTLPGFSQEKGRPDESKRPSDRMTQSPGQSPSKDTATLSPEQQAVSTGTGQVQERYGLNLSAEQSAIARHVWESTDRVIMIRGGAGTGKTHTMKATIAGIDRPVIVLAPSAEASRGVLRKEGFKDADTVARFLMDDDFQSKAKGGVFWVDEAGLLGIRQVRAVFDAAERLNARVVLQGDRRQHGSVERGAVMRVLEQFAGLPVAELKDIRRQRGQYKAAVESLSKGDMLEGFDRLDDLGWVRQVDANAPLVDDYMAGLGAGKDMLVVAPTHVEGDEITGEIRQRMKDVGLLTGDDQVLKQLRPLGWTDAQKGDLDQYDGTETLVFHRNSGTFKAGQTVRVADLKAGFKFGKPSNFAVYTSSELAVAAGDAIRVTANGKTKDGKHKLNNGAVYEVEGFTEKGDLLLTNGWVIGADFRHLTHGYVVTSHAAQGKTVDRVLIAMGEESLPATSAEQFYVSVSRGRESATIYSNVSKDRLREAILRTDGRKSATELMGQKPPKRGRVKAFLANVWRRYAYLRSHTVDAIRGKQQERDSRGR